ncbi:MAG: hypothetical protein ACFFAS_09725 [Promethearchaeota archaeon]
MALFDEIAQNFDTGEKVLFSHYSTPFRIKKKNRITVFLLALMLSILFDIIVFQYMIMESINITDLPWGFLWTLVFIGLIIFSISSLIGFILTIARKQVDKTKVVIVSDKKIYSRYVISRQAQLDVIKISEIKGINYTFNKKKEIFPIKTISFISDFDAASIVGFKIKKEEITINYQKLFESIVFEFGNTKQRTIDLMKKLQIQIPLHLKFSQHEYKRLKRRKILYFINSILLVPIFILGLYLSYIYFTTDLPSVLDISPYLIAFSAIYILTYFRIFLRINKLKLYPNDIFIFGSNDFLLQGKKVTTKISFDAISSINIFSLKKIRKKEPSLDKINMGICINGLGNSIEYGPLPHFLDLYETFFLYILGWKAQNNLLYSKGDILKERPYSNIEIDREKQDKNSFLETNDLNLEPLDKKSHLYNSFKNHLGVQEKIYFEYDIKNNLPAVLLMDVISIIGLIVSIFIVFTRSYETYYDPLTTYILPVAFIFTFIMLSIGSIVYTYYLLIFGNLHYLFTDVKIITRFPRSIIEIPYEDIASIVKTNKLFGKYNIVLKLKKSLKKNPFSSFSRHSYALISPNTFFIKKIPNENDLITPLKYLRFIASENSITSKKIQQPDVV